VLYFPASGQGAAVMANGDGGGRSIVREVLAAIGATYRWPGAPAPAVEPLAMDRATLDTLVGTYEGSAPHNMTVTARVSRRGDRLFIDAPSLGIESELVFTRPGELLSLEAADTFSYTPAAGRVAALVFGDMKMSRLP
jgi:hypothetical protein